MPAAHESSGSSADAVMDVDVEQGPNSEYKRQFTTNMERVASLDNEVRCQIAFSDLNMSVMVKEAGSATATEKRIIKGVSGVIEPGRLTAVMGASGAGKTSMLNLLAGMSQPGNIVTGSIMVNGEKMTSEKMRTISGFVHQEDVILDTMTVREALLFAAQLKLPNDMPEAEKMRRAMDIADLLNLRKALDSVVGNAMVKGISGGEKRRLSLGMEMVTNPSILFLDEPTSGLDSFTAYKVVRILSAVAHKYGRTIVCTIHQPSSEVFAIFDDALILAEGEVMYHGSVPGMVPYFAALGYQCPNHFNPADYLFMSVLNAGSNKDNYDFVQANQEDEASKTQAREAETLRVRQLLDSWQTSPDNKRMLSAIQGGGLVSTGVHQDAVQERAGFWRQFYLLSERAGRNAWRNQLILKSKIAQTVFLGIIVGLIYLRIRDGQQGVQDREGSLFFIVVQALFGSLMGVLTVFGGEKVVFQREYGSRMYGLPSYFISRWLVELPSHVVLPILSSVIIYWMVGYQNTPTKFWWFALIQILMDNSGTAIGIFVSCLFRDINVALAVMPMFLMPLMIFSGFFVNSANLGWWFRWISYISPMKYGFIALAKNEFDGLLLPCSPGQTSCNSDGFIVGESVVTDLGFDNLGSVGFNAGILALLTGGFLMLAYIALWAAVRRAA